MPLDISDLPDARITDLVDKQVNRYQAVAARLANNCVQVKTWCVTAVGAIAALGVNNDKPALFGVGLAIVVIFMALDVQYLWLSGASARARISSSNEPSRVRFRHSRSCSQPGRRLAASAAVSLAW